MIFAANEFGSVCYGDSDSVAIETKDFENMPNCGEEMGQYSIKAEVKNGNFIAQKTYVLETENGTEITAAGMPKGTPINSAISYVQKLARQKEKSVSFGEKMIDPFKKWPSRKTTSENQTEPWPVEILQKNDLVCLHLPKQILFSIIKK
jgi:hypothetical protein